MGLDEKGAWEGPPFPLSSLELELLESSVPRSQGEGHVLLAPRIGLDKAALGLQGFRGSAVGSSDLGKPRPSSPLPQTVGTDVRAWHSLSPGQKLGQGPGMLCPDLHVAKPYGLVWLQQKDIEMGQEGCGRGLAVLGPARGLKKGPVPCRARRHEKCRPCARLR